MECKRGIAMRKLSVCLSVRTSIKRVHCDKRKKYLSRFVNCQPQDMQCSEYEKQRKIRTCCNTESGNLVLDFVHSAADNLMDTDTVNSNGWKTSLWWNFCPRSISAFFATMAILWHSSFQRWTEWPNAGRHRASTIFTRGWSALAAAYRFLERSHLVGERRDTCAMYWCQICNASTAWLREGLIAKIRVLNVDFQYACLMAAF